MKVRINGTKNIAKITKSMKMVSAAKLRGDQQRLASANPFAVCEKNNLFELVFTDDRKIFFYHLQFLRLYDCLCVFLIYYNVVILIY